MPSVYMFSHSDSALLEELLKVLGGGCNSFREQWSLQAESVVEPVGWDALWKLSKEFCKRLGVRFPCVAHVSVLGVEWEGLCASVEVRGVQHERVELPAMVDDVPLIELWPTKQQTEACVDAAGTAEFIHMLRFYYNNIWMPWDDLDNKVMLPNTIEERMKLWTAMHDGSIPMQVARTITLLRTEAIKTYEKIKEADSVVDPEDLNDEDDSMLPENYMSRCAEMHARLDYLLSKWTTFENPLIRASYLADAQSKCTRNATEKLVNVLWKGGNLKEFQEMSEQIKRLVQPEHKIAICMSAEEALSSEPEQLIVCSDSYEIPEMPLGKITIRSVKGSILTSTDVRSSLLVTSEDTQLFDLTLQCRQVSTIAVVRHGEMRVKNCTFTDDAKNCLSDLAQGMVVMGGARVLLESCTFDNFYTGLVIHGGAQVELRNCVVKNCGVGIQMFSGSDVKLTGTRVSHCLEQCVRYEVDIADGEIKTSGAKLEGLTISPCSKVGTGSEGDICVVQQETSLI